MAKFQDNNRKISMNPNLSSFSILLGAILMAWPGGLPAQTINTNNMLFTINNGSATLSSYLGRQSLLPIPSAVLVNGIEVPVVSIGPGACDSPFSFVQSVSIPSSVTNIGDFAFVGFRYLTNVEIGSGVVSIGPLAFAQSKLYSVAIPNTVRIIGDGAFQDCSWLTNVTIGAGVTNMGGAEFLECFNLQTIAVDASNPDYSSVDGVLFDKYQTTLIAAPGVTGSYHVPNAVTDIGTSAFQGCVNLTNLTIGSRVTSIGYQAIDGDTELTSLYFCGNAPSADATTFTSDSNATIYYLPGTSGWTTNFYGLPTALWHLPNPLILTSQSTLGIQTNQFGFTISWATNISVVVDACTNLSNPVWQPVQTNTLIGGTSYFSDPLWTNHRNRFYRLSSP